MHLAVLFPKGDEKDVGGNDSALGPALDGILLCLNEFSSPHYTSQAPPVLIWLAAKTGKTWKLKKKGWFRKISFVKSVNKVCKDVKL